MAVARSSSDFIICFLYFLLLGLPGGCPFARPAIPSLSLLQSQRRGRGRHRHDHDPAIIRKESRNMPHEVTDWAKVRLNAKSFTVDSQLRRHTHMKHVTPRVVRATRTALKNRPVGVFPPCSSAGSSGAGFRPASHRPATFNFSLQLGHNSRV